MAQLNAGLDLSGNGSNGAQALGIRVASDLGAPGTRSAVSFQNGPFFPTTPPPARIPGHTRSIPTTSRST